MNAVDQYVANEFFKKRILLFDGYSFEQFFTEIMVLKKVCIVRFTHQKI